MKARFLVTEEIKARLKGGRKALLEPGQIIAFDHERAKPLVEAGKLQPLSNDEVICFGYNDSVVAELRKEGFVCYTAIELEGLTREGFRPDEPKRIQEIKMIFLGKNNSVN